MPFKFLDELRAALNLPLKLHIEYTVAPDHAPTTKPTIIMLHGIASSSEHWRNLRPLLEPHYRCVTVDLLGFGRSPKPARSSYTVADHARSLRRTIRALRLTGDIILVGHSLGSLIATRYASAYPDKIARVVLLSPPVYLPPSQLAKPAVRGLTEAYLGAYRYLREHKEFTLDNAGRIIKLLHLDNYIELNEANWLPFTRSLERCIESQTFVTDIATVKAPVDIFYGELDPLIIKDNLKIIERVKGVTLHPVSGADHVVRQNYAKAVAQALTK